jgi:hypothetical protein
MRNRVSPQEREAIREAGRHGLFLLSEVSRRNIGGKTRYTTMWTIYSRASGKVVLVYYPVAGYWLADDDRVNGTWEQAIQAAARRLTPTPTEPLAEVVA